MSHGSANNIWNGVYKTKTEQKIKKTKSVKDWEIRTGKYVSLFFDCIEDLVLSSRIKAGLLLRFIKTAAIPTAISS